MAMDVEMWMPRRPAAMAAIRPIWWGWFSFVRQKESSKMLMM
jgi:hypothetical protein